MEGKESPAGNSRRVVVIGGGVAGSLVAKLLQFDADVTLIDSKDYFEITWASLRSMVEPSFAKRSVISHKEYLKNGRVVSSPAIDITDTDVICLDDLVVGYDYLVIATGHNDAYPKTRSEKLSQYQSEYEKIRSSGSILIVGGGPTGVELAAEIAVDFPEKKVTLVHRGPRLLEFIGQKAGDKAFDWLKSKRVEVILNQSVDLNSASDGNKTYRTSGGETIHADCHFLCTGKPLASGFLKETFLKDNMDGYGRLMVDGYLRVEGLKNVFAIGDITNIEEMKQGYIAEKHASVAAKNIKLLMSGERENKMSMYKTGPEIAIVSLGRWDAVAQFPFITVAGCLPGFIKSRDLFVGKTRKARGLDADLAEDA
ncbi:PREDICTED: apoptosis-inducing factor homolog A-like [Tarenaya hassleriana]|uniref:apoptosis-inducing factor homolog A-like n=1 Tax=Tarenaya hassleriana TaxID=28532 RepID=UPI00053C7E45|nr:PREDICTED: apoptosis-inducing factor homolog A-like [Tarenaya hassleriana]XP_010520466.1 PREDICTED: apoptosis-inducing factor homolog A-like [Tarenaya hassleriana]